MTCIHCKQEFQSEVIISNTPNRYRMRRCPHCQELTPIKTFFIGNDGQLIKTIFDKNHDPKSIPEFLNATKEFVESEGKDFHTYKYKLSGIKGFNAGGLVKCLKRAKFSDVLSVLTLTLAVFEAPSYFLHAPTIEIHNYYYGTPARPGSDTSKYKKTKNDKPALTGPLQPDTSIERPTKHSLKSDTPTIQPLSEKPIGSPAIDYNNLPDVRVIRRYLFEKNPLNKNEIIAKSYDPNRYSNFLGYSFKF
jgi:hypothetical protein